MVNILFSYPVKDMMQSLIYFVAACLTLPFSVQSRPHDLLVIWIAEVIKGLMPEILFLMSLVAFVCNIWQSSSAFKFCVVPNENFRQYFN